MVSHRSWHAGWAPPILCFDMGVLTGERRAIVAAVLAFYGFFFLIVSLAPPPGWARCFAALAGVYGLGFFAVVAGYFWARWFAMGLGLSGAISAAISMWQVGPEPVLVFYGGTHLLISGFLWGKGMALAFDGRKEWRKRFHLDEPATHKLGKAIVRAGISLPYILMYALAPREGAGGALAALAGMSLAVLGVSGLVKARTWGLVALSAGAAALAASLAMSPTMVSFGSGYSINVFFLGQMAVALLAIAVAPFAGPVFRYLRQPID